MTFVRGALGLLAAVVLVVVLWAFGAHADLHGGMFDQFAVITTLPWGKATVVDLYAGFALFALLVWLTERSPLVALAWAAPVFVLGNIWAAVWFIVRLPVLASRLKGASE